MCLVLAIAFPFAPLRHHMNGARHLLCLQNPTLAQGREERVGGCCIFCESCRSSRHY